MVLTTHSILRTMDSKQSNVEYYPRGLIIMQRRGELVAEWKREKSLDSTPK